MWLISKQWLLYFGLAHWLQTFILVEAVEYLFLPDIPEIISPCEGDDSESFDNSIDMSSLELEYEEDVVKLAGHIRFLWHSEPDDNMELSVSVLQKKGPKYVPTVINIEEPDGCKVLFEEGRIWYTSITSNVVEEDQVCLTHHDEVIWHFHPFNASLRVEIDSSNAEGSYKLIVKIKAVDKDKNYKSNYFCFQTLGDLILV